MASEYDIVIIGSGPAGLAAALSASQNGAKVLLCEKLSRPSVKLLASGGGRCNFSNTLPEQKFMAAFGRNGRFMTDALRVFGRDQLLDFLRSQGVEPVLEDGVHYFPKSRSAMDVRDAFLDRAVKAGAVLKTDMQITALRLTEDGSAVAGIETANGFSPCSRVILAAGGMAMSTLGGTSAGLELARKAGHTIVKPLPAMAPLRVKESFAGSLAGVSLPDAALTFNAEKRRFDARGELVFTHDGLSGPAALDLSADAYRVFEREGELEFFFNPVSKMTAGTWRDQLEQFRTKEPQKLVKNSLAKFMPHSLADALCGKFGLADFKNCELSNITIEDFSRWLTAIPMHISALCQMNKAMAMSGGVSLKEVNPKTMESRLVSGLYFAGEILDLAGPCGGYFIQFSFSSGYLAGLSAAEQNVTQRSI